MSVIDPVAAGGSTGAQAGAPPELAVRTDVELRPSLVRDYSDETLACYQRRLAHYQEWCVRHQPRYQAGIGHLDDAKLLQYVAEQIARHDEERGRAQDSAYRRLSPSTLRQAINALVFWKERSDGRPPEDRAAKELVARFEARWVETGHEPQHQVRAGRRRGVHRPRRSRARDRNRNDV